VWLDRGELDKILDRTGDDLATSDRRQGRDRDDEPGRHQSEQGRRDDDRHDDHRSDRGRPRKRRSFLDELFDIG
jgi:Zn-finger nucleic acid-binding protein